MSETKAQALEIPGYRRSERWIWGLCAGLCVAVCALFCASGWGVEVYAFGDSLGARIFYCTWLACLLAALARPPASIAPIFCALSAVTLWGAALGSFCRASAAMCWHPVVLGVNAAFCLLGLLAAVLAVVLRGRAESAASQ